MHSKPDCRTSVIGEVSGYLYAAEAVRTVLAVKDYPVFTQTVLHSFPHYFAAVSVLQEALPLLTAAGIVVPQSHQPLCRHTETEHGLRYTSRHNTIHTNQRWNVSKYVYSITVLNYTFELVKMIQNK